MLPHPPSTATPLRIFLCHATQDRAVIRKLHEYLTRHGLHPWMAELDLPPAEKWEVRTLKALRDTDVILVCLSRHSRVENRLVREMVFVLDAVRNNPGGAPRILPVRLEDCAVPKGLSHHPRVDLFGADGGRRLLESLSVGTQVNIVPPRPKVRKKSPLPWIGLGGLFLVMMATCLGLGWAYWNQLSAAASAPVVGATPSPVPLQSTVFVPSLTPSPTLIPLAHSSPQSVLLPTQAVMPSLTLAPTPVSMTGRDGMTLVFVPAGTFSMGNPFEEARSQCEQAGGPCTKDLENEQPRHEVYLDAYWIDKTEVTNGMYRQCVDSGTCEPPTQFDAYGRDHYYGNDLFDAYPVVYVTWEMAREYCTWAGRQLPSEAQWEKAARGTDARVYPWGNQAPNNGLVNYHGNPNGLMQAGSFPFGASPYGVLDMSGNAFEWIFDWYAKDYYQRSPASNPTGLDSGKGRVVRGGSWGSNGNFIRTGFRWGNTPSKASDIIGFRCVLPQP